MSSFLQYFGQLEMVKMSIEFVLKLLRNAQVKYPVDIAKGR